MSAVASMSLWQREGFDDPELTGEIGTKASSDEPAGAAADKAAKATPPALVPALRAPVDPNRPQPSAGERTLLESLNQRR